MLKFTGKDCTISYIDGMYTLEHPVDKDEVYESLEELVEDYPVCRPALDYFYGEGTP